MGDIQKHWSPFFFDAATPSGQVSCLCAEQSKQEVTWDRGAFNELVSTEYVLCSSWGLGDLWVELQTVCVVTSICSSACTPRGWASAGCSFCRLEGRS